MAASFLPIWSVAQRIGIVTSVLSVEMPVQDNLRQTLLFASALQVLGPDHNVARRLENILRERGAKLVVAAQRLIEGLPAHEREKLMRRYDDLRSQLPDEAHITRQR